MEQNNKMKFRLGALTKTDQIRALYEKKILTAANKLLKSLVNGAAEKPSLYSLIAFTVQQQYWLKHGKNAETYDYLYWQRKNWLNKGCTYYIPHKSNIGKTIFARLSGKIIAVFFV